MTREPGELDQVLGRALGRAYSRKWLSDLLVVFSGVWVFALTDRAVMVVDQAGAAALAMYLPLPWIPAVMLLGQGWRSRRERPPTLLVLRVFQQDAQTQTLYDHVVERWRLSGNTVMIAGTDLADRTLDADDIFLFLDRKLAGASLSVRQMSPEESRAWIWPQTSMVVFESTSAIATTPPGRTRCRRSFAAATWC